MLKGRTGRSEARRRAEKEGRKYEKQTRRKEGNKEIQKKYKNKD